MSTLAAGNTAAATYAPREGNTPPDSVLAPNLPTAPVGAAFGTIAATAQTTATADGGKAQNLVSGVNVA